MFLNEKCSGVSPSIDSSLHDEDSVECQNEDNNDNNDDNKDKDYNEENDDGDDRNDDDDDKDGEDDEGDCNDDSDDGDETKVEKMKDEKINEAVDSPTSGVYSTAKEEVLPIKSANGDAQFCIFKSICGGDSKKKISKNAAKTFKSNSVDVHINGPFCNNNSGKSHWAIVYGESGNAYTHKAQFITAYMSCQLQDREKVKKLQVHIDHCNTYYEIGICKNEYAPKSLWKHCPPNQVGKTLQPVTKMSFVYSCDTNEGNAGKESLIELINFFLMIMKNCDMNPIGPFLLEHLKDSKITEKVFTNI